MLCGPPTTTRESMQFINLSASGTRRQYSTEKATHEIQKYFLEICNFHTLTSPIQQMKDKLLVNLPIVSNKKKGFTGKAQHNI